MMGPPYLYLWKEKQPESEIVVKTVLSHFPHTYHQLLAKHPIWKQKSQKVWYIIENNVNKTEWEAPGPYFPMDNYALTKTTL